MKRSGVLKRRKPLARTKPAKGPQLPAKLANSRTARAALLRALAPYSENTARAYRNAWARWSVWCQLHELAPAPIDPTQLIAYLEERAAELKPKSVRTTLAALSTVDRMARGLEGEKHPQAIRSHALVRGWLRSWARSVAGKEPIAAAPIGVADLLRIARSIDQGAHRPGHSAEAVRRGALRDRALIAFGWFAALRRSELAALDVEDVRETPKGLELAIRRSKTDQEGEGTHVAIYAQAHPELCPVQVWRAWRAELGDTGPAFPRIINRGELGPRLRPDSVSAIVERRAKAVGVDATSHSLRGGFATAAAEAGKQERDIQKHGRWKSVATVRRYVDRGDQWNNLNPTKDLT